MGWTAEDIPDLSGKVAVVTGANTGLGKEITARLAEHNGTVVMACRTASKAEEAKKEILAEIGEGKRLDVMKLDVSSLESVRSFAVEFSSKYNRLDILMENAGVMALDPKQESVDGLEMQFATNHIGHFLLTKQLIHLLEKTEGSRVVTHSSAANFSGKFQWDNIQGEKKYKPWDQYAMTKLANICFANELNKRIQAAGKGFPTIYSVHPGAVRTQLQDNAVQDFRTTMYYFLSAFAFGTFETGSRPALFACTAPDAEPGAFYGPTGLVPFLSLMNGNYPGKQEPNKLASDSDECKKL
uniref:Protochlorophyllide reductase n=1 Tax=Rhodosorus marinus TaxID=101924 RepID=A0A7S0BNV8_9RHOD|mmetsp:Transcript_24276/g.35012  ORF Transcript_24276/g.35012 Transcript_24276/m.35012 type:complete len:298 (+) Transcript_24276:362-1255(+)